MSRSDMSDLEWESIKCVLLNKSRGVILSRFTGYSA